MAPRWRVRGETAPKHGHYTELAPIARRLEVDYQGASQLELDIDGTLVVIGLEINSGAVTGLVVKVAVAAPEGDWAPLDSGPFSIGPFVTLTAETQRDREGKERGISREVQLGDEAFDRAVYIDSDADDSEVKRLLLAPKTRAAAIQLAGLGAVTKITREFVTGSWASSQLPGAFEPAQLVPALEALLAVARGGGTRVGAQAPWRRGWWLPWVVSLACLGAFPWLFGALYRFNAGWLLPVLGAAAGVLLVFPVRPLIARLVAGNSGSFTRYRMVVGALFLDALAIGPAGALSLNAALDRSRTVVMRGTVTSLGSIDGDSGLQSVTITWEDGETERADFKPMSSPGASAHEERHQGGLGFPWRGQPSLQ